MQRQTYHYWHPLDESRIQAASRWFLGTHDFAAMASKGAPRETTIRTVLRCDVERDYDEIRIDVEGRGFLYNQVRNMVGTLIEVGRGRWEPVHIKAILESLDRGNGGPTAPARGLSMQWVKYPPELLHPEEPGAGSADQPAEIEHPSAGQ
jgi:tRNA pseudouridine38-40 synthase